MKSTVEVSETDFRRLLAAIGQLLGDQKVIDQSGHMDNYVDAARSRGRMPANVAELKAAYDLFVGPIPYRTITNAKGLP